MVDEDIRGHRWADASARTWIGVECRNSHGYPNGVGIHARYFDSVPGKKCSGSDSMFTSTRVAVCWPRYHAVILVVLYAMFLTGGGLAHAFPRNLEATLIAGDKKQCADFVSLNSFTKLGTFALPWKRSSSVFDLEAKIHSNIDPNIYYYLRRREYIHTPDSKQIFSISVKNATEGIVFPGKDDENNLSDECRKTEEKGWCEIDEDYLIRKYNLSGIYGLTGRKRDGTEFNPGNSYALFKIFNRLVISIAPLERTKRRYRLGLFLHDPAWLATERRGSVVEFACLIARKGD